MLLYAPWQYSKTKGLQTTKFSGGEINMSGSLTTIKEHLYMNGVRKELEKS
jgi:hypothetical protein